MGVFNIFENILDAIFTPSLMSSLGESAEMIYSWSTFALWCFYLLVALVGFWAFLKSLLRWTR